MSRKKSNTKPIMTALIISWIVILFGIRRVFFKGNSDTVEVVEPTQEEDVQKWYIGENVLLEGTLTAKDGFGLYTHSFVSKKGELFGAKSSLVDLFKYNGLVEVKGSIVEIKKSIPVIGITEIIEKKDSLGNSGYDGSSTLEGNPALYYDLDTGLAIDLGISNGYEIDTSDEGIRIVDDSSKDEVLFIEPFTCKQGDPLQDCAVLKDRFVTFNNDSFTNAQGITFYNLTETNTWFAFHGNKQGYSIRANDPNKITTFGSLIDFISEDELDQFVIENKALCKSLHSTLDVVSKVVYEDKGNGLFDGTVTGKNDLGVQVTCTIAMKVGSPLQMEVISYDDGMNNSDLPVIEEKKQEEDNIEEEENPIKEEVIEEDVEEEIVDREGVTPPSDSSIRPESFDGWLQYSSIRGFVMRFSKQGVSYGGSVLSAAETFGMNGVSCRYRVNVIAWKRADFVSTEPDVEVYECTGIDKNNLPTGLQYVGSAGEKQFVAKWYTNNLGSMEIFVENQPEVVEIDE